MKYKFAGLLASVKFSGKCRSATNTNFVLQSAIMLTEQKTGTFFIFCAQRRDEELQNA